MLTRVRSYTVERWKLEVEVVHKTERPFPHLCLLLGGGGMRMSMAGSCPQRSEMATPTPPNYLQNCEFCKKGWPSLSWLAVPKLPDLVQLAWAEHSHAEMKDQRPLLAGLWGAQKMSWARGLGLQTVRQIGGPRLARKWAHSIRGCRFGAHIHGSEVNGIKGLFIRYCYSFHLQPHWNIQFTR